MSAYLKEIANDVWKAVFWPLFAKTRNNRLFWMILLGIFTLVNTINVNSIWDIAFLVFFAFLFGFNWSAWWHRVDEEVDSFWYKELDIDQLMYERDEAVALLRVVTDVFTDDRGEWSGTYFLRGDIMTVYNDVRAFLAKIGKKP